MLKTQHISQHAGFGSLVEPITSAAPASGRSGRRRSGRERGNKSRSSNELVRELVFDELHQQQVAETESDIINQGQEEVAVSRHQQVKSDELVAEVNSTPEVEAAKLVEEEIAGIEVHQEQRRRRRPLAEKQADNGEEKRLVEPEEMEFSGDLTRGRQSSGELVQGSSELESATKEFKAELVWTNILLFVILHSCLPIGLYMLYRQRPWLTLLFSIFGMYASGLGVTGGSHRLWSHRAYKAKWPVQVILVILQTMAGQNSIYTWSRDHRVHHKFAETDADPHNIKRGFFFAHMGWLCCKKHPEVKAKGKLIDMSDLEANPFVMFQHRHFWWMSVLFTVLVPTMIPVLLWNERFWTSFVFSFMVRYLITLHGTWLVNSAAHYYGERPYDERIEARESPYVIYNGLGEGFHNYHHTFPYDYATSEFGKYLNITTTFIDLCATLGLVEGRRKVDAATILKRRLRTGDLTDEALGRTISSKSIEETDESTPSSTSDNSGGPLAPFNNIIQEMPYISGLTSMQYTM